MKPPRPACLVNRMAEAPVPSPLQNDSGSVPVGRDEVIMREVGRVGTKPAKKYLSMMYFNGLVWFAVWIDCGQPVSPARKVVT